MKKCASECFNRLRFDEHVSRGRGYWQYFGWVNLYETARSLISL